MRSIRVLVHMVQMYSLCWFVFVLVCFVLVILMMGSTPLYFCMPLGNLE